MFGIPSLDQIASVVRTVVAPVEKAVVAPVDKFVEATAKPTWAAFMGVAGEAVHALRAATRNEKQIDGYLIGGDGKSYPPSTDPARVPPVLPRSGTASGPTILYVNGAFDGEAEALGEMHSIADTTGSPVIGIYNANENPASDLLHIAEDMVDASNRPSADTVAAIVYDRVKTGQPVTLYGHSQGAAILSRAMDQVIHRLETQDGLSAAEAQRRMSVVHIETFGGAGFDYPDGPQYVHYVNEYDPVTWALGVAAPDEFVHPGRGAVIHWARIEPSDPLKVHSMQQVYMPMWRAAHNASAAQ